MKEREREREVGYKVFKLLLLLSLSLFILDGDRFSFFFFFFRVNLCVSFKAFPSREITFSKIWCLSLSLRGEGSVRKSEEEREEQSFQEFLLSFFLSFDCLTHLLHRQRAF